MEKCVTCAYGPSEPIMLAPGSLKSATESAGPSIVKVIKWEPYLSTRVETCLCATTLKTRLNGIIARY